MRHLLVFILGFTITAQAQQKNAVKSGPWAGDITTRTAFIWAEVLPTVKTVSVHYHPLGKASAAHTVTYKGLLLQPFNPIKIGLTDLEMNTLYQYDLIIDGKIAPAGFPTQFRTLDLWQWRKPAPDFSFLAGSCAYFNEPIFDRPGKPYGGDSSIFETMANTPADFHIWMGDNWYTREVDFFSAWGLQYRASRDRSMKILQKFMAAMPQYSIWDDHDFGPDNSGKSYLLKDESRNVFMNYSLHRSYGENNQGIYSLFNYSDVDFFLTDDRYFRAEEDILDSIGGMPNPAKTYFGHQQMEWLQNALLYSKATFKIIVTGSQVLNSFSISENMQRYGTEYTQLMNFLTIHKIPGVIFMSGDRHHSEVIKKERDGLYPLYDITISPYTAGVSKVRGAEKDNPGRIKGTLVEEQNFGKITVAGAKGNRTFSVELIGLKGVELAEWSVNETELKN